MKKISRVSVEEKKNLGFKYHVAVMCSGNDTTNLKYLRDAKEIARGIAERDIVLVNGASEKGLMGVTGREAFNAGGRVYGVGLKDYEPKIHSHFTNWEGYSSYKYRIQRLTDLADAFVCLAGGLGAIHEILDVHINQLLGKESRPLIIMSPMAEIYKDICDKVKQEGLYWDKLPENIYFVENAKEALEVLDKTVRNYNRTGYINKSFYPVLTSEAIYQNIKQVDEKYNVLYSGMELVIHPDVYPPNRFRSSQIFAKYITEDLCTGKKVFDIGCGPGNLGILAATKGARKVVSVDINPSAVVNTQENIQRLGLKNIEVREGSVFEAIKNEKADVILFHPPFHHETIGSNKTKLMNSVSTDGFNVLNLFFKDVVSYLNPEGSVYLGFSNKDKLSLKHLEGLMKKYKVTMVAHEYKNSQADYRLYKITI